MVFSLRCQSGYPYPYPMTSARSYFQEVVENKDMQTETRIDAMSIYSNVLRYERPDPFYEGLRYTILLEAAMCDLANHLRPEESRRYLYRHNRRNPSV